MTGPLCDGITGQEDGQETLEALDRSSLFIFPLDDERRWFRYHHLFVELLRQRLQHSLKLPTSCDKRSVVELHIHASIWYEDNGLEIEAFQHAAAANDVKHAARLIEGKGMPLTFRGVVSPVLNWPESLPTSELDANPLLWVTWASAGLARGQARDVEPRFQAAEIALRGVDQDDQTRDVVGRIAATRATLTWGLDDAETIVVQSQLALENLHPDNLPFRTSTVWKLAHAYNLQGERTAAIQAYNETISMCEATGNTFIHMMAAHGLGELLMAENLLHQAAKTYGRVLELSGDQPAAGCGRWASGPCSRVIRME
jgi:LuxR family maltose regulon positive regulatory protein